jgi:hypothetical protein
VPNERLRVEQYVVPQNQFYRKYGKRPAGFSVLLSWPSTFLFVSCTIHRAEENGIIPELIKRVILGQLA